MKIHPYQFYAPPWCMHPPFESIDFCWGLAISVDKNTLTEFFKERCDTCDLSKHFNKKKFEKICKK